MSQSILRAEDARKLVQQVKDSEHEKRVGRIENCFKSTLTQIQERALRGDTSLKVEWQESVVYLPAFLQRLKELGYKTEVKTVEGCMYDFQDVYISW